MVVEHYVVSAFYTMTNICFLPIADENGAISCKHLVDVFQEHQVSLK